MPTERSDSYETGQGSLLGQQFAALVQMHTALLEMHRDTLELMAGLMEQNRDLILSMSQGYEMDEEDDGSQPYYLDGTKAS